MNTANTLKEAENLIAGLSESDKAQLLRWLQKEVKNSFPGIEKTSGLMGGIACIRQTRIPVWLIEQAHRQGLSDSDILRNYPALTTEDLANARNYIDSHLEEMESQIAANEAED